MLFIQRETGRLREHTVQFKFKFKFKLEMISRLNKFTRLFLFLCNCTFVYLLQQQATTLLSQWPNNDDHFNKTLKAILRQRVVGTTTYFGVQNFIINELQRLGFSIETDTFNDIVPILGNLTFTNIIGTLNPNAGNFVTLACHYDSKYFPNNVNFLAAIDSAVPCTILLNVAATLNTYLLNDFKKRQDLGLMLIFFDGEEAFQKWTKLDSLYGSRHLAQKFASTYIRHNNTNLRRIETIKVLILLDLLGAKNTKLYSFYKNTYHLYARSSTIEEQLRNANQLESLNKIFFLEHSKTYVQDDHLPFLHYGVPIMHLIATPFPKQWHKPEDDAEHLHWPFIRDFNKIFRILIYSMLVN